MRAIAAVAEKYGEGRLHLTMRQGIEIHFVHASDAQTAIRDLESAGVTMGADGNARQDRHRMPRFRDLSLGDHRHVRDCPGVSDCKYFAAEAPYKFKIAVTGCPNNCAKATQTRHRRHGGDRPCLGRGRLHRLRSLHEELRRRPRYRR